MTATAPAAIDELIQAISRVDWAAFVRLPQDEDRLQPTPLAPLHADDLIPLLDRLLARTLEIHTHLADGFLNHQAHIVKVSQPYLAGL